MTTTIVRLNRFGQARFTGKFAARQDAGRGPGSPDRPGYAFGFSTTKIVTR